jgi:hypothetical protein
MSERSGDQDGAYAGLLLSSPHLFHVRQSRGRRPDLDGSASKRIESMSATLSPDDRRTFARPANRVIVADARHHGIDLRTARP